MKTLKAVLVTSVPAFMLAAGGTASPQTTASQPSSQPATQATQPLAGVTTHPAVTTQPQGPIWQGGPRAIAGARL
jgi:hypothetical protein